MKLACRTLSVSIDAPALEVYRFASEPLNMPKWAAGLGSSISKIDGRWMVETPSGVVTVEFAARNNLGVLDHTVTLGDGTRIYMPMRVIANGEGAELVLTLYRQPGMSEAQFEKDAALVQKDLATLKRLVEGSRNAPGS